jgi:hypothetical protein
MSENGLRYHNILTKQRRVTSFSTARKAHNGLSICDLRSFPHIIWEPKQITYGCTIASYCHPRQKTNKTKQDFFIQNDTGKRAHKMHQAKYEIPESPLRGISRDQDRAIILWFCTDGGKKDSFTHHLNSKPHTFGETPSKHQKKQFSNRVARLNRIWSSENTTAFTGIVRDRGFDRLAAEIETGELVPLYIQKQHPTTPSISASDSNSETPSSPPVQSTPLTTPRRVIQFPIPTPEELAMDHIRSHRADAGEASEYNTSWMSTNANVSSHLF